MLDWLPYVAIALIAVGAGVAVLRVKGEDPGWAARWRGLDPADRARIRKAVYSGALLADPEELELAAGLARRDQVPTLLSLPAIFDRSSHLREASSRGRGF